MSLISVKCPDCKETIQIEDSKEFVFCMMCGSKIKTAEIVPAIDQAYVDELFRKAEEGDITAQYELGTLYRTGVGVKQSYSEAMNWYLKAADQGDPFAMYNIGQMYSCGFGVKQNCAIAASWYAKATENGINDRTRKR